MNAPDKPVTALDVFYITVIVLLLCVQWGEPDDARLTLERYIAEHSTVWSSAITTECR